MCLSRHSHCPAEIFVLEMLLNAGGIANSYKALRYVFPDNQEVLNCNFYSSQNSLWNRRAKVHDQTSIAAALPPPWFASGRRQCIQERYMKCIFQVWGAERWAKTDKGPDKVDYPMLALENTTPDLAKKGVVWKFLHCNFGTLRATIFLL